MTLTSHDKLPSWLSCDRKSVENRLTMLVNKASRICFKSIKFSRVFISGTPYIPKKLSILTNFAWFQDTATGERDKGDKVASSIHVHLTEDSAESLKIFIRNL